MGVYVKPKDHIMDQYGLYFNKFAIINQYVSPRINVYLLFMIPETIY